MKLILYIFVCVVTKAKRVLADYKFHIVWFMMIIKFMHIVENEFKKFIFRTLYIP